MSIIAYIEDLRRSKLTAALIGLFRSIYRVSGMHTHINSMPEEMLLMIFKTIFLEQERDATFKLVGRRPETRVENMSVLLTLSHVCRIWRAIILAYPCFWTRADGHNRDLLDIFVERAGRLPLSLFVTTRTHGLLDLLASHGRRIKRLDIMACEGAGDLGDLAFVDGGFFLFGERILPLVALSIVPYAGRFPANHFPNLTHLWLEFKVRTHRDTNEAPPFSSTFFDFLSNTPKLEFMTLSEVGNSRRGFDQEPIDVALPVHLRSLRSLVFIMGDWVTVGMVLSRLSVPDSTILRLLFHVKPTPDLPPLPLPNVVQSIDHLRLITDPTFMLLIADSPSSGIWLAASVWEDIFDDEDDVRVNWSGWLASLPTILPLAQVTTLEISVGGQGGILSSLLPKMSGLVELSVRFDSDEQFGEERDATLARWLFEALAEDPLICPNLQVLNIDLGGETPADLYPYELGLMVMFRSRVAHPIRRLVIQPFADMHTIDEASYDHVARSFQPLKAVVDDVRVPGPGLTAIPSALCDWRHSIVDGYQKYWY
ncbi:hypothetical protein LXA43DRAFT_1103898 [Ganoderma leucocontextum]|nr:hypothetical protein LXA43DRAFT_1103898 [Ganoderma leucocontextum]